MINNDSWDTLLPIKYMDVEGYQLFGTCFAGGAASPKYGQTEFPKWVPSK